MQLYDERKEEEKWQDVIFGVRENQILQIKKGATTTTTGFKEA